MNKMKLYFSSISFAIERRHIILKKGGWQIISSPVIDHLISLDGANLEIQVGQCPLTISW